MGFLEVLTIIFVVLKLLGVITWSWFFVFLPLIIAVGFYVIVLAVYLIMFVKMKRKIDREFDNDFFNL